MLVCAGGIYLGIKFMPGNKSALSPTQAQFTTALAPVGITSQVTIPTLAMQPQTETPPAVSLPNATGTVAPLATAAASLPSINVHATPGTILEVPGKNVAFSPDGKWLVIGNDKIHFYESKNLQEIRSIQADSWVNGLAISPDSKVLADIDESRGVMLFDLASGSELRTLPRTVLSVGQVTNSYLSFSPDSQTLAVLVADTIKLFNVADGQEKGTLVAKGSDAIVFSTDGKSLYAGGWAGMGKWDVATGAHLLSLDDMSMTINCLALSPDGNLLVSGGTFDKPIVVWDPATGQQVRTLTGHTDAITSLVFSPDGKLLASSAGDVTIKLWDVATGNLLQTLVGPTEASSSLAISPDGATLASIGYNQGVWLWGVTGK